MSLASSAGGRACRNVEVGLDDRELAVHLGRPPSGSTMIIPYMPLAMWCTTGAVPQWYMNTPGWLARELERPALAGHHVGERVLLGAMRGAWKSIECGIVVLLRMRDVTRSPTRTRTTGPGTRSAKVHTFTTLPGAISTTFSVMSQSITWTAAGR